MVIENSQFDDNQDGVDTNTQIAGDPPPPQNGACPDGATSPITHTHSCWVFIHNNVHDNNNGNTPEAGNAGRGPHRDGDDPLRRAQRHGDGQHVLEQRGLGHPVRALPRQRHPSLHQKCANYGGFQISGLGCVFEPEGDALKGNTFVNDGYDGNPSNADFGQIAAAFGPAVELLRRQHRAAAGARRPNLEQLQPICGVTTTTTNADNTLLAQVECDSRLAPCPAGANYPAQTGVRLAPLPRGLPTMANPSAGVPSNAWCPSGGSAGSSLPSPPGRPRPARARPGGRRGGRRGLSRRAG